MPSTVPATSTNFMELPLSNFLNCPFLSPLFSLPLPLSSLSHSIWWSICLVGQSNWPLVYKALFQGVAMDRALQTLNERAEQLSLSHQSSEEHHYFGAIPPANFQWNMCIAFPWEIRTVLRIIGGDLISMMYLWSVLLWELFECLLHPGLVLTVLLLNANIFTFRVHRW